MRRLAFGHLAANVVRRAEFAAADLDHGVPHLRLEPDAGSMPVDFHIANHVGCLLSSRALHLGSAQDGKLEVKDHTFRVDPPASRDGVLRLAR
jgi:hypothetical protein